MNILEKIAANKRKEVEFLKEHFTPGEFEKSMLFSRETFSLTRFLLNKDKSGIIAEFKRKSPAGGLLNILSDVESITKGYSDNGASALSILTDNLFFEGNSNDITKGRTNINIPILRKDFILDEIQVLESKALGADAVLLIASLLEQKELFRLAGLSRSLGMEVLFEIHSPDELRKVNEHVNIVGVNNRDLRTMQTSVRLSEELADKIPEEFLKISESGISDASTVIELKKAGYNGFLIGECFMKKSDPVAAFAEFIKKLK